MSQPQIPSGLLRSRNVYRTLPGEGGFISCGFWDDARGGAMREVVYDSYVLVWILRGEVALSDWDGCQHRCPAGSCLQRLPGRRHSSVPAPGAYGECWLEVGGPGVELIRRLGLIDERPLLRPGLDLQLLRRIDLFLQRLRASADPELPRLAAELLILVGELYALDRVGRDPSAHRQLIEQACHLLRDGHAARGSLERLCAGHGIGYERFRKLFAQRIGCPVAVYRNRARIDCARELLLEGDDSVQEIAARLGWQSTASFSLYFKQMVGEAPAHFRARRRSG